MGEWTPEQQKEHRKQWVEALRSGKYEQTTGALRKGGGFCCLGVACDISGLGDWDGHDPDGYTIDGRTRSATSLPSPVRKWLGLTDRFGSMGPEPESADAPTLTILNDEHHKTFAELADLIESEPQGLIAEAEAA